MIASVLERLRRLAPGRVPAPYLAWAIACWTLTAAIAVVILVPGLTDGIAAEQEGSTGVVGVFTAPLGIRLLVTVAGAVLVGALVVAALLRAGEGTAPRVLAVAAGSAFPVVALAAERHWLAAAAALLLLVVAMVLAARRWPAAFVGVLAAGVWIVLAVGQFAEDADGGWTWIALFGAAAAFAAFGAYYGVARAAESRSALLRPLFRDDLGAGLVLAVVAVVVVLTALRLTVAREIFPAPDPELWSPLAEAPLSWLHAALVAGLVVVVAVRSVRRPLRRSRARGVTAALAVAGNAQLLLGLGVIVVGLVIAAVTGGSFLPDVPPVVVAALKFAGTLAIVVVALTPPFRGTTARALAVVTGAYLVPLTLHGLLAQTGSLPLSLVGFPASPVQLAVLLLAVAVVAALIPPVRRAFGPGLVVRLGVVPFVAVHAGWLLPAAWSGLGLILLVVGVLLALLVLMPKPPADPIRHAAGVLAASGGQLLALLVFALAIPSFLDDPSIVVLGLFWLAVAVIAGLVVRTQPGTDDVPATRAE
jgi:hypothetical protein